jgi:hypothetical protein
MWVGVRTHAVKFLGTGSRKLEDELVRKGENEMRRMYGGKDVNDTPTGQGQAGGGDRRRGLSLLPSSPSVGSSTDGWLVVWRCREKVFWVSGVVWT